MEIDLAKVPGPVLDVSTPAKAAEHLQTPFTRNAAAAHQEVLIHRRIIPADAIRLLKARRRTAMSHDLDALKKRILANPFVDQLRIERCAMTMPRTLSSVSC